MKYFSFKDFVQLKSPILGSSTYTNFLKPIPLIKLNGLKSVVKNSTNALSISYFLYFEIGFKEIKA